MPAQITDKMLTAIGGSAFYTLTNVGKARAILQSAGVEDVELHPLEVERIREIRRESRGLAALADQMLASGPLPPCTCTLNSDGTVESASGCKLGHRPGHFPEPVE